MIHGLFIAAFNVLVIMTCVSPSKVSIALGWELQISSFFLASAAPVAGMLIGVEGFECLDNLINQTDLILELLLSSFF